MAITFEVVPAQYKNIDGNQYVVVKRGYAIIRWLAYDNDTEQLDYTNKREFVVSPHNVDTLLGIDVHSAKETMDGEGEVLFYKSHDDSNIERVFRITSQDDGSFNLMYAGLQNEEELVDKMDINLKKG